MDKPKLTEAVTSATDFTKADTQRAIDALFDTDSGVFAGTLDGGQKVQITDFGTLEARRRKARMGPEPADG